LALAFAGKEQTRSAFTHRGEKAQRSRRKKGMVGKKTTHSL